MYCEKCGQQLNENERFCPKCGTQIVKTVEPIQQKRLCKRKVIGVVLTVIIVILGITVGYFLKNGSNAKKNKSTQTENIVEEKKQEPKQEEELEALYAMPYNGKWGWVNEDRKYVIGPKYDFYEAFSFEDSETAVITTGDGFGSVKAGVLNREGELILPADKYMCITPCQENENVFCAYWYLGESPNKDETSVKQGGNGLNEEEVADKYRGALIDLQGNVLTQKEYKVIFPFNKNGLAVVCDKETEKFGLINMKGNEIIKCEYDSLGEFCHGPSYSEKGIIPASLIDNNGNAKWGYINDKGEVVLDIKYEMALSFDKEGMGEIATFDEHGNYIWSDVDEKGKIAGDFRKKSKLNDLWAKYDSVTSITGWNLNANIGTETYLYMVCKDEKYGVIDINDNEIIKCEYSEVFQNKDKFYVTKKVPKENKIQYGIMNLDGSWFMEMTETSWYYDVPKMEEENWRKE